MQRVPDVYRPEKLGGDVFAVGVLALGLNGIDPPALTTALRLPDNTRVVHLGRVDRKVIEHQDRQRRTERGKQSRGQEVQPLPERVHANIQRLLREGGDPHGR